MATRPWPVPGRSEALAKCLLRWPGLFTMTEARALASQSRCGNPRLESRVRENRTHGSEGGEGEPFPTPIESGRLQTFYDFVNSDKLVKRLSPVIARSGATRQSRNFT